MLSFDFVKVKFYPSNSTSWQLCTIFGPVRSIVDVVQAKNLAILRPKMPEKKFSTLWKGRNGFKIEYTLCKPTLRNMLVTANDR